MEQESGMDRFADRIVAAERERNIGNPALMLTCGNAFVIACVASM